MFGCNYEISLPRPMASEPFDAMIGHVSDWRIKASLWFMELMDAWLEEECKAFMVIQNRGFIEFADLDETTLLYELFSASGIDTVQDGVLEYFVQIRLLSAFRQGFTSYAARVFLTEDTEARPVFSHWMDTL